MQKEIESSQKMSGAIVAKDVGYLLDLLDNGYPVDQSIWAGKVLTALHEAAEAGFADGCRVLIERGATVDMIGSGGVTPLHKAAKHQREDVCKLLLEAGANVHAADSAGLTALMYVASHGHVEAIRVANLLVAAGADPNREGNYGSTALRSTESGDMARALIAAGAEPNRLPTKGRDGSMSPFQWAVKRGLVDVVRACLECSEVDLDQRNSQGRTLAQLAGKNGEVKQLLLAAKTAMMVSETVAGDMPDAGSKTRKRSAGMVPL